MTFVKTINLYSTRPSRAPLVWEVKREPLLQGPRMKIMTLGVPSPAPAVTTGEDGDTATSSSPNLFSLAA